MLARHFDPSRPCIASSSFATGDETIAAGDTFDWRARGMNEIDVQAMFGAGLLVHPPSTPAEVVLQMPGVASKDLADDLDEREVTFRATPSERVNIETPSQRKRRKS